MQSINIDQLLESLQPYDNLRDAKYEMLALVSGGATLGERMGDGEGTIQQCSIGCPEGETSLGVNMRVFNMIFWAKSTGR